jgi:hypothetical protein
MDFGRFVPYFIFHMKASNLTIRLCLLAGLGMFAAPRSQAQVVDTLYFHAGDKLGVTVASITPDVVRFSLPLEPIRWISKASIANIHYAAGAKEKITDRVVINSEDDWEKVILLTSEAASIGLLSKGKIEERTAAYNFHSASSASTATLRRLLKAAARRRIPFVLLTDIKTASHTNYHAPTGGAGYGGGFGGFSQYNGATREGELFTY